MSIRTVRAKISLKTPSGTICKYVNWSYFEQKAALTTSTTSYEAYNRFLINSKRIIDFSELDLKYLYKICFYEETRYKNGKIKSDHRTHTLVVNENSQFKVLI